uniref:Uncharacterized protein n=1 Tax=Panagrolaimus sp. ES5 TaxID=591445 RepID=A0AC34F5F1_9BILA
MQNRRQLSLVVITIFGIFGFYDKLFLFAPLSPKEDTAINDLKDVETLQEKNNIFKRQQQHPNISNINNYYQCELETPNPWDPTITKYLKPNIKKCETNFQNLTFLNVNGYISVNYNLAKVNTTCQWQCLIPGNKGADSYSSGPWIDILSEKPTCDVFKVRCLANKEKYYETLHVQIIPKPISPPNNSDQKIFNIHIFVIDSVSRSQGLRFLPKTIDFFQKEMKATHFPYFNKVGYNSYPNGNAFLYGKSVPRDNKNNNIPPIITKVLADNQTFENHYIGKILQQFGFPTLFNEDVHSIFPKASNFSTHTLAPLSQEIVKYKNFKNSHLFDDQCQTTLNFNLKMLSEFITKYSNAPKFSLNWNTFLSHDHLNHLSVADDVMLEFLRINQNEVNISLFFM